MGDRSELWATLREVAGRLSDVDERKMFGCEALFTKGAIFALVWKTGRIGVKLPEESRYGALLSQNGAEPWRAGPMTMAHWVLVPPGMEGDRRKLAPWVAEAHGMAAAGVVGVKAPKAGAKAKAPAKAKSKAKAKAGAKAKAKAKAAGHRN
jgi:TfoX/Sxy family transcriptional regulator of competence genes